MQGEESWDTAGNKRFRNKTFSRISFCHHLRKLPDVEKTQGKGSVPCSVILTEMVSVQVLLTDRAMFTSGISTLCVFAVLSCT